ncbi:receptor-like protein 7 [Magnolia sinica]|uniref:receptor-like protein 7 n=1 Tax=Magnolia sinica TaxID=86752 RepID=UPI002657B4D9|nr:receptor-like protein 7 [Magnolia sinica]
MALLSSKNPSFLIISLALCSFLFPSFVFATQQCNHHHFTALLHLKRSFHFTDGSFTNLSSWNWNNTDCCSWEGITCDGATGHVISLNLSGLWISGSIDSKSLFRLGSLKSLNLAGNDFVPSLIPSGFDQLISLVHLNLSSLRFYGQIPLEISRLTSLVSLDISFNYFINDSRLVPLKLQKPSIGTLVQNLSSLRELHLDNVNISAQGSEWGQALFLSLPHLRKLTLQYCSLSGPIHSSLSQLRFLSELDLSGNKLSSVMPNFIGNFSSLTSLGLRDCRLHGNFPESIFKLPNLQVLDMSGNPLLAGNLPEFPQNSTLQKLILSNSGFSGKLPDSLSNLKFLNQLHLWNCSLSGSLPSSLWNLTKLQFLDLSSNRLSGPIPSSQGNELLNLKEIMLWNNFLNGSIPSSLFSLPSLQALDLSGNQLTGQLGEFHNASSSELEYIYLHENNLHGIIPRSVFQLRKLQTLYLYFNNFSGVVDVGLFQNLKNLYGLDLSDNNLSVQDSGGNSTFLSFPQIENLGLRSCNIRAFPNFLRNQEVLNQLDLSNNKISGQIPKWIWEVGNGVLYSLNLSHNVLQGMEPPTPHLSSALQILDLSFNMLEGSLPIPSPSIFFFSVSNNSLHGEIPLSICNATSLSVLDLSYNHFIGQIPLCLGEIGDTLSVLNLQGNAFNGTLLQAFKEGCNIQTLDLSGNQLEGRLPRSLANCKKLEVLNLGNNQINDTFPSWVEALPQLRILVLKFNKFYGSITLPKTNQSFPMLQIIDLSSNSFVGGLPSSIFQSWKTMTEEDESQSKFLHRTLDAPGNMVYYQESVILMIKGQERELTKILTIFTAVDLSNNYFHGDIPKSIGNLKSLRLLNMSHNSFTGQIPTSLENLAVLESLDLSQNNISGEIPWQLTKLTFLSILNLSQNHLVGSIPQNNQFFTFTNESFQGNSGLCGLPLSRKCIAPPSIMPTFEDTNSELDWKFMWIGFGVGHGVGMGVLFWTLTLWTKGRTEYNKFIDGMLSLILPSTIFSLKRRP